MAQPGRILCVLSESQRAEYRKELVELKKAGVKLILSSSPESIVDKIDQINPVLVILGTQIQDYEGIELMSMIMQQYKDFYAPIVILPEKDDGLAPILHFRSTSEHRSSVKSVSFDDISQIINLKTHKPVTPPAVKRVETPEVTIESEASRDQGAEPDSETTPSSSLKSMPLDSDEVRARARSGAVLPRELAILRQVLKAEAKAADEARAFKIKIILKIAPLVAAVAALVVLAFVLLVGEPKAGNRDTADDATAKTGSISPQKNGKSPEPGAAKALGAQRGDDPLNRAQGKKEPDTAEVPRAQGATKALVLDPQELMAAITFKKSKEVPVLKDRQKLESIAQALKSHPKSRIVLTGHASSDERPTGKKHLGMSRATQVRNMLVKLGVSESRFETRSRGDEQPVAPDDSPEGRSKNRRVTIELIH